MATLSKIAEGYGAALFTTPPGDEYFAAGVEIQVHPDKVNVYLHKHGLRRSRRATITDMTARNLAAEVCNGNCWPDVLADRLEEVPPASCDHDFPVAAWLRKAS